MAAASRLVNKGVVLLAGVLMPACFSCWPDGSALVGEVKLGTEMGCLDGLTLLQFFKAFRSKVTYGKKILCLFSTKISNKSVAAVMQRIIGADGQERLSMLVSTS